MERTSRARAVAVHAAGAAIRWGWDKAFRWGSIHPGTRAARRFGHFGDGSIIGFPIATLMGEQSIWIGDGVCVGPYCSLSAGIGPGQVLLRDPTLRIGDRSVVGRACTLAAHFEVVIGDGVWLAPQVFVTDQGHGWEELNVPIGRQLGEAQPVAIGDGSWLGHGVIVLPGVTIGEHVAVGAGAIVTTDLPDRCVAVGAPARPVREHHPAHGWVRSQQAATADLRPA